MKLAANQKESVKLPGLADINGPTSSTGFWARIHRGADEIGGSCIELAYDGERILLDLGKPLEAERPDPLLLPAVPGLQDGTDSRLHAIVISHGHVDHWGLAPLAHTKRRSCHCPNQTSG